MYIMTVGTIEIETYVAIKRHRTRTRSRKCVEFIPIIGLCTTVNCSALLSLHLSIVRPYIMLFVGIMLTIMWIFAGLGETKRVCVTYEDRNVVNICNKQWIIIIIGTKKTSLGKPRFKLWRIIIIFWFLYQTTMIRHHGCDYIIFSGAMLSLENEINRCIEDIPVIPDD